MQNEAHDLSFIRLDLLPDGTLVVGNGSLLGLDLCDTALDVGVLPIALVHARNEIRSVGEEVVHLLKRTLGSFRQEAVEEDGVGQVADLGILLVLSDHNQGNSYLQQTEGRTSSQCSPLRFR